MARNAEGMEGKGGSVILCMWLLCTWSRLVNPPLSPHTQLTFFDDTEKMHCSLGEEGEKKRGEEEVGKKQRYGFSNQAFHLSPAIGHQKWENTDSQILRLIPIPFSSGLVEKQTYITASQKAQKELFMHKRI